MRIHKFNEDFKNNIENIVHSIAPFELYLEDAYMNDICDNAEDVIQHIESEIDGRLISLEWKDNNKVQLRFVACEENHQTRTVLIEACEQINIHKSCMFYMFNGALDIKCVLEGRKFDIYSTGSATKEDIELIHENAYSYLMKMITEHKEVIRKEGEEIRKEKESICGK